MSILVIGDEVNLNECREKFGSNHHYKLALDHAHAKEFLVHYDLIFDFIIDKNPANSEMYTDKNGRVFLNASKINLRSIVGADKKKNGSLLMGFCGLPTFLNRPIMEVSLLHADDQASLEKICHALSTEFLIVEDRVGLVTPRVICMIINEAFFTLEDGTASRSDIDLAMKLGTNYPYGPFEWCERIGIDHVYELLEAVYKDTKDERYKICPLLKRECLR